MLFCNLVLPVCHEHSDLSSNQNVRHSLWQAPMCFQKLKEKHEIRTLLEILGCTDTVSQGNEF